MENNTNKDKLLTLKEVHISKEEFQEKYPIYEKYFEDSLENPEYTNIAITGNYGIGKSTIFKSFLKNNNKRYAEISIGAYGKEFKNKNNLETTRILERQIIHQLVSQINPNYIPFSKYRISKQLPIAAILLKSFWVIMLTLLFSFFSFLSYYFYTLKDSIMTVFIILATYSGFILLWILVAFVTKYISKISFKYKNLSLDVDIKNDKFSEFDNNIPELVDILIKSGKNIIVFEDLDRFGNDWIFLKLRELNLIVNNYIHSSSSILSFDLHNLLFYKFWKRERKISFVYLVSTKIFNNNYDEFIKFFDISIPIIPSISDSSSIIYFKEIFKEYLDYRNFNGLIMITHKWFNNFRKIHDLYNEFTIYWKQNENKSFSEPTSLLAFLILKKEFPSVFEKLVDYKSDLFKDYVLKQSLCIEWKSNIIDDVIENLKKFVSPNYSYHQYNNLKEWCDSPGTRYSIFLLESGNWETCDFYEFYSNLRDFKTKFMQSHLPNTNIKLRKDEIKNNYVEGLGNGYEFLEWLKSQTINIRSFLKYNSLNVNYESFELVEWPIAIKATYEELKEVQITFGMQNFFKYFKEKFSENIKSKPDFNIIFNKFFKNNGDRDILSQVYVISKTLEITNKIDKHVLNELIDTLFESISKVNYNIDYLIKIFWFVNSELKIKFVEKIFDHRKLFEFRNMLSSLDKAQIHNFWKFIIHLDLIKDNVEKWESEINNILNNKKE